MLYEDNEGLVRLQVDVDDNGGDVVNHDYGYDDGDTYHYDDNQKCFQYFLQNPIYLNDWNAYQKQNATKWPQFV